MWYEIINVLMDYRTLNMDFVALKFWLFFGNFVGQIIALSSEKPNFIGLGIKSCIGTDKLLYLIMKKFSLLSAFLLFAFFCNAQESASLIGDIMAVAPVTVAADETQKKADEDFGKDLTDQQTKVDELLSKHSEKFKKDVISEIEQFNKILGKAIERDVSNEKQRVVTRVHTLAMTLKSAKKDVVQQFENKMRIELRNLSGQLKDNREKELNEVIANYRSSFDQEFDANQQTIKTFKDTQHLTKTLE